MDKWYMRYRKENADRWFNGDTELAEEVYKSLPIGMPDWEDVDALMSGLTKLGIIPKHHAADDVEEESASWDNGIADVVVYSDGTITADGREVTASHLRETGEKMIAAAKYAKDVRTR